jgi:predicted 2-oxoglutarate/Fe(II)-dependent dioxygenase YbiX
VYAHWWALTRDRGCCCILLSVVRSLVAAPDPNGGYYRRHVDSYANTPQALRKFSFLLYCNEEWTQADGGCLRIHTDGGGEMAPSGTPPSYVDVEPTAGTLVLFRSDVPHEVLDTSASRLAMVGWFNSPPEGSNERRTLIAALAGALLVGSGVKTILGGGGGK